MLGQAVSMVLPKVVGYRITGNLSPLATSTDVVLTITKVIKSQTKVHYSCIRNIIYYLFKHKMRFSIFKLNVVFNINFFFYLKH